MLCAVGSPVPQYHDHCGSEPVDMASANCQTEDCKSAVIVLLSTSSVYDVAASASMVAVIIVLILVHIKRVRGIGAFVDARIIFRQKGRLITFVVTDSVFSLLARCR